MVVEVVVEEVEEVEEEEVDKLFGKVAPSTLLLPRERMPPLMELRWAPLLPFKAVDVPVCRGTGDNRFMVRSVVRKQLKKTKPSACGPRKIGLSPSLF